MATQQFLHRQGIGRVSFVHKLSIYLTSIQETQLRLHYELERFLRISLSAIETLSKGYLPAYLSPQVMCNIISNELQMVQEKNPSFVLTVKQVTES